MSLISPETGRKFHAIAAEGSGHEVGRSPLRVGNIPLLLPFLHDGSFCRCTGVCSETHPRTP